MTTFLLLWDGSDAGYDPDEYLRDQSSTSRGERPFRRWSFGRRVRGAAPGDRVFLLRQHSERGIVASGYLHGRRGIYEAPHWNAELGGTTKFIEVEWDAVVASAERLPTESLLADVPAYRWNYVRSSGQELTSPAVELVETLWIRHLATIGRSLAPVEIRAEAIALDAAVVPVGGTTAVLLEEIGTATYDTAGSTSTQAVRREAQLVDSLSRVLEAEGHEVRRYRIALGDGRFLYTDIADITENILWEAKGTNSQATVRAAIGQLLDYRRFIKPTPKLAVLLPERPEPDLERLLKSLDVGLWFEEGGVLVSR